MSEIKHDSILAIQLYDLCIFNQDREETAWYPTQGVFYELMNNSEKYNHDSGFIWIPTSNLPKGYNGNRIAKVLRDNKPSLVNIWFEDGELQHSDDYDCIISILSTSKEIEEMLNSVKGKLNITEQEIDSWLDEAITEDSKETYYALFYENIQLCKYTWKENFDKFKESIVNLNNLKFTIKTKEL